MNERKNATHKLLAVWEKAPDDRSWLTRMRKRDRWLRGIAIAVAAAFLNLTLQPLAIAANAPDRSAPATSAPPSNEEKLSQTLQAIEDRLDKLETRLKKGEDSKKEKNDLKALHQELALQDANALNDFDAIERHLKDKKLPQVILNRHYEAVRTYKQEMATLKANLEGLENAKDDSEWKAKLNAARQHLKAKSSKRGPKTKFDPNDLPNKSLQPNPKNKPKLKKEDFVRAGLYDNPTVKLASHGTYRLDQLPSASDPAFRAATTEVVLTDAIRAKAAELGHNPVKIYNWVRNNVEWLPTWGASQDADVTLGSNRGNAMDIASLLIALLRASDVPARYVHGTIEVPEDKFRNWAGGFTNITAAQQFASSGGIPITGMVSGGRITKVQLEHVWVEAAVDFEPSRGAINKSADSWVQLDATYKQYEDLHGLDVIAITGMNPEALAQSFASSGTINEQEGWVANLNPAILQNAQAQAQATLGQHIRDNLPNPTVGDVIGGRRIIPVNGSVLPSGLPNRPVVIGARYATVPGPLQHTMTFAFGIDRLGELVNPVTFPWGRLNNHKVTLSFKPATAADEQALASLLPAGEITDPSQLPGSIPSYLIYVIPELAVNGQVVGQGGLMRLGEEVNFVYDVQLVGGLSHTYTYSVIAGSYLSVAVAGGSVSTTKLEALRSKLEQTKATLQSGNTAAIGALTREDIMGDMFQVGTLGYFGQYIGLSHIASRSQQARHSLPHAYGTLGYEPNVFTLFGFPRAIEPGGIAVNVRLAWNVHSLDGDQAKRRGLTLQTGLLSSVLEHVVPEQMFSSPQRPTQGVSAVKALQLAAKQAKRIYHITKVNQAAALPNLRLDGLAINEIHAALATGREVIAHTDRISVPGFTGEGYILFDPMTGNGAYKITGGDNGGYTEPPEPAGKSMMMMSATSGIEIMFSMLLEIFFWLVGAVKIFVQANTIVQFLNWAKSLTEISEACDGALFHLFIWTFSLMTVAWIALALFVPVGIALIAVLVGVLVNSLALEAMKNECGNGSHQEE